MDTSDKHKINEWIREFYQKNIKKNRRNKFQSFYFYTLKLKKERVIFMKKDEIIKSIEKIEELSKKLLQTKEEIKEEELEKYFYKFEKIRMDMYDDVRQRNLWLDFMDFEGIKILDNKYEAGLENNILKIHIPEKVPSIKRGANYIQKQIAYNIAEVVEQ